jgi:hypothetical protein
MLGPAELESIERTLERRLDAIAAYSTQVPVLAPERGPVERFWPVLPETGSVRRA